jgi:hypothetical protein
VSKHSRDFFNSLYFDWEIETFRLLFVLTSFRRVVLEPVLRLHRSWQDFFRRLRSVVFVWVIVAPVGGRASGFRVSIHVRNLSVSRSTVISVDRSMFVVMVISGIRRQVNHAEFNARKLDIEWARASPRSLVRTATKRCVPAIQVRKPVLRSIATIRLSNLVTNSIYRLIRMFAVSFSVLSVNS